MAEERGKESQWWVERQGTGLRESARHELETSPAGRRRKEEVVLRTYVRDEEKADKRQNRERSE
jgi:hypothetical protein